MSNPATRILHIVQLFRGVSQKLTVAEGWREILKITDDTHNFATTKAMSAFVEELNVAQLRLRELGAGNELFGRTATRVLEVFGPRSISNPLQNHKDTLHAEILTLGLSWAGWALQKLDEPDIEQGAMEELQAQLREQEALLAAVKMPAALRALLESQVEALKTALRFYAIQGAAPLREAVQSAIGAIGTASPELKKEAQDAAPEVQSILAKSMAIIGKAAELADKGSKVVKFGKDLYQLGTQGYGAVQILLSGPGAG